MCGIKEKFLAAYRENIKTILYPKTNEKDVSEIPEQIRKELNLIPVTHMDEVAKVVFGKLGESKAAKKPAKKAASKPAKKIVKKAVKRNKKK